MQQAENQVLSETSMNVATPNFLIAGSGESGTSWLSACLLQHPEVYLPAEMRPEPHFFYKSAEYEKGIPYYLNRYFSSVPEHTKAIGERSSSYIFLPVALERIAQHYPDIKLIIMLREPVSRAYSNWRFSVQSGVETLSFEQAIAQEQKRHKEETNPFWKEVQPFAYTGRSLYGPQIEQVFTLFSPEQVLILNSDHVKKDEPKALRRVCEFLGVDDNFAFAQPGTFPTASVRNRSLQKVLRSAYGSRFDRAIENTRTTQVDKTASIMWLDWLLKLNMTYNHPTLNPETAKRLEQYFYDSNQQLAPYVDWNPFSWFEM